MVVRASIWCILLSASYDACECGRVEGVSVEGRGRYVGAVEGRLYWRLGAGYV